MKRQKRGDEVTENADIRPIADLLASCDHVTKVVWAADCAERTLELFERMTMGDRCARTALEAVRAWTKDAMTAEEVQTAAKYLGKITRRPPKMAKAARVGFQASAWAADYTTEAVRDEENALRAAIYAVVAAAHQGVKNDPEAAVREIDWQYARLQEITGQKPPELPAEGPSEGQ